MPKGRKLARCNISCEVEGEGRTLFKSSAGQILAMGIIASHFSYMYLGCIESTAPLSAFANNHVQ